MGTSPHPVGNHEKKTDISIDILKTIPLFKLGFKNFFHPYVGELIAELNQGELSDIFNAKYQGSLTENFFESLYKLEDEKGDYVDYDGIPKKEIDVDPMKGTYAVYNWELFFHIPLTVAVHLSKNQRFAEAQRWFHFIFDPTSADPPDDPKRFWNFLMFRNDNPTQIDKLLEKLSEGGLEPKLIESIIAGYNSSLKKPFQPHAIARTRQIAYQYCVVMKYLDNQIAWGDNLFQQDTVESINEATMHYVLAANILGPRPELIPPMGKVRPKSFFELKDKLDAMGNALCELEGLFPFNLASSSAQTNSGQKGVLFGIGRSLYFCIPRNDKLLGYWDTVADRLFKIRNSMNIQGVVRPLPLFDPPIDPGMLVKAAAAGIDISSIVNGLNQPVSPVRSALLIQKALELCSEVKNLGGALLAALEKGDSEHLALIRQRHEVQIQEMSKQVRFLQWKAAEEATQSLLTSRATALERFCFYRRLLGLPMDPNVPNTINLDRRELTEDNFDEAYTTLIGQYDKTLALQNLPGLKLAEDSLSGSLLGMLTGATGQGKLYLNVNEDADLNVHSPKAHVLRQVAMAIDTLHGPLSFIPDINVDFEYWGIGTHMTVFGGSKLVEFGKLLSSVANMAASEEEASAVRASKTAGFERRADDWLLQYNLAAHELMQIGRQILTSLISEQVSKHEYLNIQQQIKNAQEVDQFLHEKFTNEDLYLWMQGEVLRLFYEYYRFAFDTARKAERTMKQELMRPEVDAQDFVKFNYWDSGRKGLLSGEALFLDIKRMEMAYLDNNKREHELTKHVSLRQLDPVNLLRLKSTGKCEVSIPEWLYDLDCPGHYMRRIKNVSLSIPCITGPYTSVNCTVSLLKSSLRKLPVPKDGEYLRQGTEDERFIDYVGSVQSIVTSNAQNDSGMFETNLRDERFLPFEGSGAESTWQLELPKDYPAFDYATISDVILHIRYTARTGVNPTKVKAALSDLFQRVDNNNFALLFSLRYDFSNEWSAFLNAKDGANFTAIIRRDHFPYFIQSKEIIITRIEFYGEDVAKHHICNLTDLDAATIDLNDASKKRFTFVAQEDPAGPVQVLNRKSDTQAFLVIRYSLS